RRGDGLRGLFARRRLRKDRERAERGEPGCANQSQLRLVLYSRDADHERRACGCIRVRRSDQYAKDRQREPGQRGSHRICQQSARDRGGGRQSEEGLHPRRSRAPGCGPSDRGAVLTRGAVRARRLWFLAAVRPERPPILIAALAIVAVAFFILPLVGLLSRAPWQTALSDLTTPEALTALRLSLVVSLAATAMALVL